MAQTQTFQAPGGTIQIEVAETEGRGGAKDTVELGRVIGALAAMLSSELGRIEFDNAPTDIVVRFGVNALARGAFAIAANEQDANFRIAMTWSGDDDIERLGELD